MAIRRKLVECDCGERFEEDTKGHLSGNVTYSPWKHKNSRIRGTKSPVGGEIVQITFERTVECKKCRGELFREKNEYDVTPGPIAREPKGVAVANYVKEMIVTQDAVSVNSDNSNVGLNGNGKHPAPPPPVPQQQEPPTRISKRPSDPTGDDNDSSLNLEAIEALKTVAPAGKPRSSPSVPVIHLTGPTA